MKANPKGSELGMKHIPTTVIACDASQNLSTIASPLSSARKRDNGQAHLIKEFTKKIKAGWTPEEIVASFQDTNERAVGTKRTKSSRGMRKAKSEIFHPSRRVHVRSPRRNSEPLRRCDPPSVVELSASANTGRKSVPLRKRDNVSFNDTVSTLTQEGKKMPNFLGEVIVVAGKHKRFQRRGSMQSNRSGSNESVSISNTTLSTLTQEGRLPDLSEEIIAFFQERKVGDGGLKEDKMKTSTKIPPRNIIKGISNNYKNVQKNATDDKMPFKNITLPVPSFQEKKALEGKTKEDRIKAAIKIPTQVAVKGVGDNYKSIQQKASPDNSITSENSRKVTEKSKHSKNVQKNASPNNSITSENSRKVTEKSKHSKNMQQNASPDNSITSENSKKVTEKSKHSKSIQKNATPERKTSKNTSLPVASFQERKILEGRPKEDRIRTSAKKPSRVAVKGVGDNYRKIHQNTSPDNSITSENVRKVMEKSKLHKRSSHSRQRKGSRESKEDSPILLSDGKYLLPKGKRRTGKYQKQIEDERNRGYYGEEYASVAGSYDSKLRNDLKKKNNERKNNHQARAA